MIKPSIKVVEFYDGFLRHNVYYLKKKPKKPGNLREFDLTGENLEYSGKFCPDKK